MKLLLLKQYIDAVQQLGDFTAEQINLLLTKVTVIHLKKNSFLMKKGQVCRSFWFVNEGSLRRYQINQEDIEETLGLFVKGDWLLDYESFTGQKPSIGSIQAYEDCELVELSVHSFHELINQCQAFFRMGKILQSALPPFNSHASPEEKYIELLNKRPDLFMIFPLQYIASYLAIAPETLSRIRRKLSLHSK